MSIYFSGILDTMHRKISVCSIQSSELLWFAVIILCYLTCSKGTAGERDGFRTNGRLVCSLNTGLDAGEPSCGS